MPALQSLHANHRSLGAGLSLMPHADALRRAAVHQTTGRALRPTRDQGERTRRALLRLPDQVARELDPESLDSLRPHMVSIDLDGISVRALDLEGLLETKQTSRDKDKLDRTISNMQSRR